VLTAGLFTKRWKLEGSFFNGREPNERRWDFDRINLDSYSGRLTFNPTANWSASAGFGFLKSPEALEPDESKHRTTASLLHSRKFGMTGESATSLVWGANKHPAEAATHSLLVESRLSWNERNTVFARGELLRKSAAELVLDTPELGFESDREFDVASLSVGYTREVYRSRGISLGIGGLVSVHAIPEALEPIYGSRTPTGTMIFLRLRPLGAPVMNHAGMSN
jgi:hypothetical protein